MNEVAEESASLQGLILKNLFSNFSAISLNRPCAGFSHLGASSVGVLQSTLQLEGLAGRHEHALPLCAVTSFESTSTAGYAGSAQAEAQEAAATAQAAAEQKAREEAAKTISGLERRFTQASGWLSTWPLLVTRSCCRWCCKPSSKSTGTLFPGPW